MKKGVRIFADYRPDRKSRYDFIVNEDVKLSTIKKYFQSVYSWLKVYECYEIPVKETIWPIRLHKRK